MFRGFVDELNSPRYCPPPLLDKVPRSAPVELTNTRSVAPLLLLVASTRNERLELTYSARVIRIVSVLGGCGAARVTVTGTSRRPNRSLRIVRLTVCVEVTFRAVAVNLTLEAPAGITTVAGAVSAVVLLLDTENEKPPAGATAPAVKLIVISVDAPEAIVEGVAVTLP